MMTHPAPQEQRSEGRGACTMAETVTKKSSKDDLFEAVKKWQKRATESETKRRSLQDAVNEMESRIDGLMMQVQLYKEKDKESTERLKTVTRQNEEQDLLQASLDSLNTKCKEDAEKITSLEERNKVLDKENATLKAATSGLTDVKMDLNLDTYNTPQLQEAVREREQQLREAQGTVEEFQLRLQNLTKSHEAFIEQTRTETEAEVTRRVESTIQELNKQKSEWEQDRTAMVETHVRQLTELQTMYNELKEGLEKSQAWTAKDKEVQRLKEEIEKITNEYNTQADRLTEFKKYQTDCTLKDELIANLRDQILEAEGDMAETRTLCMQALKQAGKPEGRNAAPSTDGSSSAYLKGSVSSAASSASMTPPPSPKEKSDLFDIALSGRAKSRREVEIEKQLSRFKSRVRADEAARQRNMDEVESYRADYVNALITEVETLRKTAADKSAAPSGDVVRMRGEFQRERESWEMEKMELEKKLQEQQVQTTDSSVSRVEVAELQERCCKLVCGRNYFISAQEDVELEKELLEREVVELKEGHEVKERGFSGKIEAMRQQVEESEDKGKKLQEKFADMEATMGVSLQAAQKLREAEITIARLTAEMETLRASPDNTLPKFLRESRSPPLNLSPPPEELISTKEALAVERKARLEAVRQQLRSTMRPTAT